MRYIPTRVFIATKTEQAVDIQDMGTISHPLPPSLSPSLPYLLRRPPRARRPTLGINNDILRQDQTRLQQRHKRQLSSSRVAARVSYQTRFFYLVTMELRDGVDSLFLKLGGLVFSSVPFLVHLNVGQAEVRGEIHDLDGGREGGDDELRGGVGQAAENDVDFLAPHLRGHVFEFAEDGEALLTF